MKSSPIPASTRRVAVVLLCGLAGCLFTSCKSSPQRQGVFIRNPYDQVDWARDGRFLANFHTHTTGSDGGLLPHDAIDHYRNLGYSILAITDHNAVTYPWEKLDTLEPSAGARDRFAAGKLESAALDYENRDPAELGMIAIHPPSYWQLFQRPFRHSCGGRLLEGGKCQRRDRDAQPPRPL